MQTRVYSNAKLTVLVLDKGATGDGPDGGASGTSGGQMLREMSDPEKEELSVTLTPTLARALT